MSVKKFLPLYIPLKQSKIYTIIQFIIMDTEKHIICPTCGTPLKVHEDAKSLYCINCHRSCILSEDHNYAIDSLLMDAGNNDKIPVTDKPDILVSAYNGLIKCLNGFLGLRLWTKISIVAAIVVGVITCVVINILNRPEPIENCLAYAEMTDLWKEFREKNPYNTQIVGLKEYSDGSFTIILSEPSEHVTRKKLVKFVKPYNHIEINPQTQIGIDGWLKDALICFNDVKDFKKFTSDLFELLYGTDYKATYTDLSQMPSHVDFAEEDLNYQISAEELRAWLIDGDESFHNDRVNSTSFPELFNLHKSMDIYYSDTPGFVVWLLPRHTTLKQKDFDRFSRIFALDTDLILGAISTDRTTAIIGRERCVSIDDLPPMRIETMRMLAQTTESELSQSYERNHLFAGKSESEWDLAPILLSDELWHTEYGSMLNITDQMLKSWSENGSIDYYHFGYSHPTDWAFYDGALSDLGATELTYNWNTAGAGYVIEGSVECPYDIYALNRTGSLPVSYIPGDTDEITVDDQIYQFEEKAYDFFSNLSSPELVKVAEYASLYQIFRNFDICIEKPKNLKYNTLSTASMDETASKILRSLRDFGDSEKNSIEVYYAREAEFYRYYADSLEADKELTIWLNLHYEYYSDPSRVENTISKFDSLKCVISGFKNTDNEYIGRVAHYVVNPRSINYGFIGFCDYYLDHPSEYIEEYGGPKSGSYYATHPYEFVEKSIYDQMTTDAKAMLDAMHISDCTKYFQFYNNIIGFEAMDDVLARYVSDNKNISNTWIKCPTIVCSFSQYGGTGGHNLNSKITPVKVDRTLSKGQFKVETIEGKKVVSVSAVDKGRITPSFLRQVERTNLTGMRTFVTEAKAIRPRKLVFAQAETRSARGFNAADHVRVSREAMGFKVNDVNVGSIDELFAELRVQIANGEKLSGKTIVFENFNEGKVRLIMDGVENTQLLSKGMGTKIQLDGYDLNHITYDMSKAEQGITIVRVPIKPKAIVSPDGNVIAVKGNSIFNKVEHVFEIPTKYVKQFITRLNAFVKDGKGFWNDFLFKQDLKRNNIDSSEIQEIYNYMIAQIYMLKKDDTYAGLFEEKIA